MDLSHLKVSKSQEVPSRQQPEEPVEVSYQPQVQREEPVIEF